MVYLFQISPANYQRQIDVHYGSLPRQQFVGNGELTAAVDSNANPATNGHKKGVAFGRGFSSLLGVRGRGHSVPNLGDSPFLGMASRCFTNELFTLITKQIQVFYNYLPVLVYFVNACFPCLFVYKLITVVA